MTMTRAELQDTARKAFGADGHAPDADTSWRLISEMGWLMMAVPEELGGLGLGREAAGVIHTELGRALVPGPVIAQMLVIEALSAADGLPERDDLLARAMHGEVMTASLAAPGGSGPLACVPDADRASYVLMTGDRRVTLVPLDGATMVRRDTWDPSRRLFDVEPIADGAMILADGAAGETLAVRLHEQLLFALAGDSLGAADAILELTVDYLKTRHQFGRPLALFQALKHRVADMKTWLAAAEALFWSRAGDPAADGIAMGALKAHATTVAWAIVEDAVQLHGGIGLTSEFYCHLFLKRVMLNAALAGDAARHDLATGQRLLAPTIG